MRNITLPTNIFRDERIVAIAGEFGNAAQLVVVQLLCEIAAAGYFIEWNTLKQNFYARMFCMPTPELCAIVNRLAEYGFFSKEMIEQDHVLTNEDAQRRYFRPRTRRRVITGIPHLIIPLVQWIPEEPKPEAATGPETTQPAEIVAEVTPEPAPVETVAPIEAVTSTQTTAPIQAPVQAEAVAPQDIAQPVPEAKPIFPGIPIEKVHQPGRQEVFQYFYTQYRYSNRDYCIRLTDVFFKFTEYINWTFDNTPSHRTKWRIIAARLLDAARQGNLKKYNV